MEQSQENVLSRIQSCHPVLSKGQRVIAAYIAAHYDEAVFMTAAELGKELGVSESTVVRFAAALGYHGYPEFQKALESCVREKLETAREEVWKPCLGSQAEILNSVIRSDAERLRDTLGKIDPAAFETAVGDILSAEKVYVMGLRSSMPLAEFLHFYLHMIRPGVILIDSTSVSEIFEQMIRIDKGDCFIGISFPRYSMRTLKAMELANDRNAKVIAITDDVNSPMNLYSSCNLLARSDMVSFMDSLVAPLSVINALLVAICRKRPGEVKKNLDILQDTWNNYQIYRNDEIDAVNEEDLEWK